MKTEVITLDETRNVTLTAYLQPVGGKFTYIAQRPAVLILPGGGYQYCSDREADPVAFAYLKAGFQAFILRYSVAEYSAWPTPLLDVDQAMGMMRERADEWNLYPDKICVIGFSAGGHLAAASATMGLQRPNAAILGYAVCGADVKSCNMSAPDCNEMVDGKTPPCFVFAARDDGLVPVKNSLGFLQALAEKGIAFESHIYSYGGHGFSTADSSVQNPAKEGSVRLGNWVGDSIGWLKEVFGDWDGESGMTEPAVPAHMDGNYEPYLSADCTVKKLLGIPESREIVAPLMTSMRVDSTMTDEEYEEAVEQLEESIGEMKFKEVLAYAGAPDSAIETIEEKLRAIANPETV